jgi:hypothetical protein
MEDEHGDTVGTKKNFLRFQDALKSGYVENPIFQALAEQPGLGANDQSNVELVMKMVQA